MPASTLIVCITEGIPVRDMANVHSYLKGVDDHARRPELPRRDLARGRRTSASSPGRSARRAASGW